MDKDKKDKNIKLCKCPLCGCAFYIKTEKKGDIQITCPFCDQKVIIKISGAEKDKKYEHGTS